MGWFEWIVIIQLTIIVITGIRLAAGRPDYHLNLRWLEQEVKTVQNQLGKIEDQLKDSTEKLGGIRDEVSDIGYVVSNIRLDGLKPPPDRGFRRK